MESITPQKRTITTPDIDDVYDMFRSEEKVFRLLTTYLIPETVEKINDGYDLNDLYEDHPATLKCTEWLLNPEYLEHELRTNKILCEFFGADVLATADLANLFEPMKAYYLKGKRYMVYADVFSYDITAPEMKSKHPIVLWSGSTYLGHIYCYNNTHGGNAEFIGIRESMKCTLEKVYNKNKAYSHIAFSILDGCKEHGVKLGVNTISLANPIGSMEYIAEQYGFIDNMLTIAY